MDEESRRGRERGIGRGSGGEIGGCGWIRRIGEEGGEDVDG
jgi:hypothetical protein